MNNIIINRFRFKVPHESVTLYFSLNENELFFRKDASKIVSILLEQNIDITAINLNLPADYKERKVKLSFDFKSLNNSENPRIVCDLNKSQYFKKYFVKEILIDFFRENEYYIEPFPIGSDLTIYKRISKYNNEWDIFRKYDINIFSQDQEISVSLKSQETLISNFPTEGLKFNLFIDDDNYIKKVNQQNRPRNKRIIANYAIKSQINYKNKILKQFYKDHYKVLNEFYGFLLKGLHGKVIIESGGFKTIHPGDIGKVDFEKNLMVFGKDHTDVNAASGMRDGGPYFVPKDIADKMKLFFIYQNKEQANSLYIYLKKGLKHYPGLLSYVNIPVNITNERLQYTNKSTLKSEFDSFLNDNLKENDYSDYFAIVILPFSKETATEEDTDVYYYIKQKLLEKSIASQDISESRINSASFHYHLPNISIAILAKIGGVPWKLKRKDYNELIIGFNEERINEDITIGTAVFFDNSGRLKEIKSFQENGRNGLILSLKNSIENYLNLNSNNPPERLVIHYYKPPKLKDVDNIHYLIRNEFRFNLPFALVEINESKTSTDICFDVNNHYGMPTSGTIVRLGKNRNDYLLFNNLRYWDNPVKPVTQDEYPIKIKLYNTESGGFTHRELVSQVYEFSRLYWKGLKQKTQPVTTQYSKMIAEFAAHFKDKQIPSNNVANNTAWFI